jgi:hypothetical protein
MPIGEFDAATHAKSFSAWQSVDTNTLKSFYTFVSLPSAWEGIDTNTAHANHSTVCDCFEKLFIGPQQTETSLQTHSRRLLGQSEHAGSLFTKLQHLPR